MGNRFCPHRADTSVTPRRHHRGSCTFNCEMHDQPCKRTKWNHMLHFCQDCIVDWYNETDIRDSVTVTLSEREDPGARNFRGWLPSPSDDASGDKNE